ncbi:2TM domain-containing protein [Portibacter marinus]|uniref:2TM domain-containing protein n=1 Tax=Portibacter marinus TaxID=2898660 RepID=UPI001F31810A|nr:2TM domain-containing protein [Portibacter marinus]
MEDPTIYHRARKRTRKKKAAFVSLIVWLSFFCFFMLADINDGSRSIEWAFYPLIPWGMGVLIQWFYAFDFMGMGEKWEKEEIQKEIERRRKVLNAFEKEYGEIEQLDLEDLKEIRRAHKDSDFV